MPVCVRAGTNRTADGYSMGTVDNGAPVRFDLITGWFFLLSAFFHGIWVVLGPFDRFAFLYWRQIDSAWCWWRCVLFILTHA